MEKRIITDFSKQIVTLRNEMQNTNNQVCKQTQTLTREVTNVLTFLDRQNRALDQQLKTLHKNLDYLQRQVRR